MASCLKADRLHAPLLATIVCLQLLIASGFQSYHEACRESSEHPEFCIRMLSVGGVLRGVDVSKGSLGRFQLVVTAMKSALDGLKEEIQMSENLKSSASAPSPSPSPSPTPSSSLKMIESLEEESLASKHKGPRTEALDECVEHLTTASELIRACLVTKLANASSSSIADIHTWMSAALGYQSTCLDGLSQVRPPKAVVDAMRSEGDMIGLRLSTALSFIASTLESNSSSNGDLIAASSTADMTPSWVSSELLKSRKSRKKITSNVVVAQDGGGNYKSIQEAVDGAPEKSKSTYVIHIRSGTYKEKVSVPKSKTNIMFVGDGVGKTIITGSRSVRDGVTTFKTATVEINGDGFMARDLTIENTAGPEKHQAVAIRVSADKAAFYSCSFEGYQDTLYAHVLRQFYRECTIAGTVDFIFGNAAAVFQLCTITARQPMSKQKNTVTAQGRTDANQNTGFSFMDSTIDGTSELKKSGISTFLGRPWKKYSRTVYLRCYLGSVVDSAGWLEWSGSFALKTLFYAEYDCKGPGSGTGSRVWWSRLISESQASFYAPGSFISGGDWLGGTGFPYSLGL